MKSINSVIEDEICLFPEGREFEPANLQRFTCPGGLPGGGVEALI